MINYNLYNYKQFVLTNINIKSCETLRVVDSVINSNSLYSSVSDRADKTIESGWNRRPITPYRIPMDTYRLIFYLGKKVYSRKEHTKMSKIAKFAGCEIL
jgi:hypothetical protein